MTLFIALLILFEPSNGNKKNRCIGGRVFMRLILTKKPNGGFLKLKPPLLL